MRQKPVVLCILDGWGYRPETEANAIELGKTPFWHSLLQKYPHCMLETSGLAVGLPAGQMGNSEVGHTNLGAGRVVMQDLPRIDASITDDTLKDNSVLQNFISALKKTGGTAHVMGLMGNGGVHASQEHMLAVIRLLAAAKIPVKVHCFMDGRDTPPSSGEGFLQAFENAINLLENVQVATISGRYYAMDRDNRWDRVTQAYNAIVAANASQFATAHQAMSESYQAGITDEFIVPCVIDGYTGMHDGDAFLMTNYRSDRARELTKMLGQDDFTACPRTPVIQFSDKVAMTEYSAEHKNFMHILFPPEALTYIFGEVVAEAGLTQLRIAETEKYAHVTFFFNGGEEKLFTGEERILVPSPKVATYDLKPEMSAIEVTEKLVQAIESDKFDVIIVNYANGDMVGHTGILSAAVKAVETVDSCVQKVTNAVIAKGGCIFITADHGNAEKMEDENKNPFTAHSATPVKAVLVNADGVTGLKDGKLSDVAPTLLELLNLQKPTEMTGESLIIR